MSLIWKIMFQYCGSQWQCYTPPPPGFSKMGIHLSTVWRKSVPWNLKFTTNYSEKCLTRFPTSWLSKLTFFIHVGSSMRAAKIDPWAACNHQALWWQVCFLSRKHLGVITHETSTVFEKYTPKVKHVWITAPRWEGGPENWQADATCEGSMTFGVGLRVHTDGLTHYTLFDVKNQDLYDLLWK